jgi:hypothetical protein
MIDDEVPRKRSERTGRHFCTSCLKELAAEEYFAGDFYCADCAAKSDHYPLATTPEAKGGKPEKR